MEVKQSNISVLAMRKEPNHRSEMVSQIIYGDGVILQDVKREWSLIKTSHDDYSGWIESKHFQQFENVSKPEAILCTSLVQAKLKNKTVYLAFGSFTPLFSFFEESDYFKFQEKINTKDLFEIFEKVMLDVPYLWGGRTVFGVDCSGLSQLFYRFLGINLARDASLQIHQGIEITLSDRQSGDLVFFQNDQGAITHVGILKTPNTILHSSGEVRLDQFDEKGIFRKDLKIYTHQLHSIRRVSGII